MIKLKPLIKENIEYSKFILELLQLTEKTSGELLRPKRNRELIFNLRHYPELAPEIFNLIRIAYSEVGGHVKIQQPADLLNDPEWTFWSGTDLHGTPDFDLIIFGKKTRFGVKFSGVGHDGESDSKRAYLSSHAEDLKSEGYFTEVSEKLAEILISKYKVPIVDNQKNVEKVLGKKVEWVGEIPGKPGNGWYIRSIGGGKHAKILVGNPRGI